MRDHVPFFSTYNMSIPFELKKAGEVVERFEAGWRPMDVNDVIELKSSCPRGVGACIVKT